MLMIQPALVVAEFYDPMRPPPFAMKKLYPGEKKQQKVAVQKTKPAARVTETQKQWVLNSILFSSQRQHAIINNKLVRLGDMIEGARVIRLRPDSVRLIAKGKTINLKKPGHHQSVKKVINEQ